MITGLRGMPCGELDVVMAWDTSEGVGPLLDDGDLRLACNVSKGDSIGVGSRGVPSEEGGGVGEVDG